MARNFLKGIGNVFGSIFGVGSSRSSSVSRPQVEALSGGLDTRAGSAYHKTFLKKVSPKKYSVTPNTPVSSSMEKMLEAVTSLVNLEETKHKQLQAKENQDSLAYTESLLESAKSNKIISSNSSNSEFDNIFSSFATALSDLISKIDNINLTGNKRGPAGIIENIADSLSDLGGFDIGSDDDRRSRRTRRNRRGVSNRRSSSQARISRSTRSIGEGLGKTAERTASREAIRTLAKPIISKALSKTLIKSIPIAGILGGLAFGVSRLLDGDIVGAGLEVASSVGGPLTAIPALIVSLSRDIYNSVYGEQPESDPKSIERLKFITDEVTSVVRETVRGATASVSTPSSRLSSFSAPTIRMNTASPGSINNGGFSTAVPPQRLSQQLVSPHQNMSTIPQTGVAGLQRSSQPTTSSATPINLLSQQNTPRNMSFPDLKLSSPESNMQKLTQSGNISKPRILADLSSSTEILSKVKESKITIDIPQTNQIISHNSSQSRREPSRVGSGNVPDPNFYPSLNLTRIMYFGVRS